MTLPEDSFSAEDFLRTTRGELALWVFAGVIVLSGVGSAVWAYQQFAPKPEPLSEPAGAMSVEFADFVASPLTEDLAVAENTPSMAAEETLPNEVEPEPEADPTEEPVQDAKPVAEEPPEPATEMASVEPPVERELAPAPEPVAPAEEPLIDVPDVEVPEPAVVIERQAEVEPEPETVEEPIVEPEPVDPNLPMPVAMPQRIADIRAETPPTKFTPPPQRKPAPPPQQPSVAAAPKSSPQQAATAAAPQQAATAQPSASQVSRWQNSVFRHLAQRQKYPRDAERRGEKGLVQVRFNIDTSGRVLSASISRSSGYPALDQAALQLVSAVSPVPAPPAGLPKERLTISIPLDYGASR